MKYKKGDKVMFEKNCQSATYQRNYYPKYHEVGEIVDVGYEDYQVIFNDDKSCYTYLTDEEVIAFNDNSITISNTTGDVLTLNNNGFTFTGSTGKSITGYEPEKQEMEEKEMKNEVLELWYTRKRNKIIKEYDEKEIEFNESIELVVKYNDIVDRFENELEELYNCEENIEKNYIKDNNLSESMYKYKINYDKLNDEFLENYVVERDKKLHELDELRKEIDAQLSLSSELDYQIEVLTTYGILDKKTKKMVD